MSVRSRPVRRFTAILTTLLVTLAALPAVGSARPDYYEPGYQLPVPAESAEAVPTVERTVVEERSDVLPIALAGAALIVAIAGAGYVVVPRHRLGGQH